MQDDVTQNPSDDPGVPQLYSYESPMLCYQIDDENGGHHDLVAIVTKSKPDENEVNLCVLAGRDFPNANVQLGVNYLRGKIHGARHEHGTWVYPHEARD